MDFSPLGFSNITKTNIRTSVITDIETLLMGRGVTKDVMMVAIARKAMRQPPIIKMIQEHSAPRLVQSSLVNSLAIHHMNEYVGIANTATAIT